ncbi:MAG: ECF transporter S component [Erysipelotrichaceae bacterium]|nr:ECF transporter S component [Erysipelotrichaceae bacterium]
MKDSKVRFIVSIAMLGALAGVLMFIKFPLPIAPSFYKLEFSDVPCLVGGFAMGPWAAVLICLIKNLINVISEGTTTAFVGEASNFVMSCTLCVTAAVIYKKEHTKKGAIKSMIIGIIVLAVASAVINYYVLIPAYVKFMGFPLDAIIGLGAKIIPSIDSLFKLVLFCTVPFNLIKGIAVCLITFVVYKRISPLINGKKD